MPDNKPEDRPGLTIRSLVVAITILILFHSAPPRAEARSYKVRIEGVTERSLLADLESVSDSLKWREKPPASLGLLQRRAEGDVEQFLKVLRSSGYYGAEVTLKLDEEKDIPIITFDIRTGDVFRYESVEWAAADTDRGALRKLPTPDELGLRKGEPARTQPILDAEKLLVQALRRNGHPFAKVDDRRIIVDHQAKTMQVNFHLDPGPPARFGPTRITGLKTVRESAIRNRLLWKHGDPFNGDLVSETEKELTKSELFSLVRISSGENLAPDGELPLTLDVKERKHRSIKVGATYRTDEGPGVKFSWEHRNLFHHGEKLQLSATASTISTAFDASFRKPDFYRPNQSLLIASRLADDNTDAYESRNFETDLSVERKVGKTIKFGLGPGFRWARVEQLGERDEFALLALQSLFDWDRSDNLLDPTRGGRLKLQLAPYWDTLDTSLAFAKGSVSYSHYFRLSEKPLIVLAGRAALGSLVGAERDDIPADLRFYAGGGGSIRGYPFQTVGPLAANKDPIGGRSLFEVNTECRVKITRSIGVVGFIDGGSAFESSTADFSESILWGAGVGLRYHTPIGPLRLDVGVPLDRRPEIDDPFQIYVSIGQAF